MLVMGFCYAQQFRFDNYSVNAGLPQSQVYCQLQDANGFLWLGTMGGGLARFDGRDFKTYSTRDKLANNFVHCLFQYKDTIWIGTQGGLSYSSGQGVFGTLRNQAWQDEQITSFYKDANTTIVGTNNGIYQRKNKGDFVNISSSFNLTKVYITTIYKDKDDTYWVGGSKGILKLTYHNNEWLYTRYTTRNGLGTNDIECFARLNDSLLLIGTYGMGVYQMMQNKISPYRLAVNTSNEIVHSLFVDEKLWIGTQRNGLYVVDPITKEVQQITVRDGLANDHVRCFTKDSWGTYWIGTSGGGVSKYFGQSFVHYNVKKGLPASYVYALHQSNDQLIWIGVGDRGLVKRDSIGFTTYGADSGFINQKVKAISEDKEGILWLGTVGEGIYVYNGKEFSSVPRKNGLLGRFIKDLQYDGTYMWSATIDKGIFKIYKQGKTLKATQFSLKEGVQSDRINALCWSGNKMWYGCQSKGVGFISADQVTDLSAFGFPAWSVRAMRSDGFGNIWLATGGQGLIRIYPEKKNKSGFAFQEYGYNNGMLSTNLYLLTISGNKLYLGSENGLDELTFNEQYDVIESTHYGYDEGFVGVETCQDAVLQDHQGNFWFGTINGLSQYKPSQRVNQSLTPKVSFTQITANYLPITWLSDSTIQKFTHTENTLTFEFAGIDLSKPQSVTYSYHLLGSDEGWSKPSAGNSVRYANLKAGDYVFEIKATSDGKVWSEIRKFHFHINQPFWKTWWFWLLCICLITLLVWGGFKWRISKLQKQADEERLQYQLKNDLLQLEQKALRLQMNPHFLFNALNSIQGLIIKNDQKGARYYLAKFAHLMRQILDNSRNASISLEEELKTLENYLLIERLSKKDSFAYTIKVDESIHSPNTTIPPMILQPFVENAIIHAFTGMENEGVLRIEISQNIGFLNVIIADNGIGRAKAGEISKKGINRKSVGLEVTEQRLAAHNGNEHESLLISDIHNEAGEVIGTLVKLKIRME